MAYPTRYVLVDGVSATIFKTTSSNIGVWTVLPQATIKSIDIQRTSLYYPPIYGCKRAVVRNSPVRKTFLIQLLSHPAISICCTVHKENICPFIPSIRNHCFAEVTHTLMQTDAQQKRGGTCQANKQHIKESRGAV
jgi:hypothetical protein